MKKSLFLAVLFTITGLSLFAQAPEVFNYSAIARNGAGQPVINQTIAIQFVIRKTSNLGPVLYTENHIVQTDAYGLFNLPVGGGSVLNGSMSAINWSIDNYYLEVKLDITGGANFATMGTTQLLSVPYALHAKTANDLVGKHYIGEQFGGGVIFHLWRDQSGEEHGLIVDLMDLGTSLYMDTTSHNNGITLEILYSLIQEFDGSILSDIITGISVQSAASLCLNSTNGGFSDWYLPSYYEMSLLKNNLYPVENVLRNISNADALISGTNTIGIYWTGTVGYTGVFLRMCLTVPDYNEVFDPTDQFHVRAIRKF